MWLGNFAQIGRSHINRSARLMHVVCHFVCQHVVLTFDKDILTLSHIDETYLGPDPSICPFGACNPVVRRWSLYRQAFGVLVLLVTDVCRAQ